MLYRESFMFESRSTNDKEPGSGLRRAMDIVGSVLALPLLFPLFVLIAIAIKLTSKGPVLFRQWRFGQNGKPFVVLKFRSMYVGNDPRVHLEFMKKLIMAERHACGGGRDGVFKLTRDPRSTPLGAFLRRTGLDELPLFINILKGDISLPELWHPSQSAPPAPPVDPPSRGGPDATVYAPLKPKPAPRSGAIALSEPNDTEDMGPHTNANGRAISVAKPKAFIFANPFAR